MNSITDFSRRCYIVAAFSTFLSDSVTQCLLYDIHKNDGHRKETLHTPLAFKIAAIYLSHSWRWFTNKCIVKKPIFSLQPWRGRAKQTASCLCCLSQNVMEIEDETFTHCFKITLNMSHLCKVARKAIFTLFQKNPPILKEIFQAQITATF